MKTFVIFILSVLLPVMAAPPPPNPAVANPFTTNRPPASITNTVPIYQDNYIVIEDPTAGPLTNEWGGSTVTQLIGGLISTTNTINGPINAYSFGMRGDGLTDNATYFANAMAGLPANSELFFPPGLYKFTPHQTYTRSNIKISGSGAIFQPTGTNISLMTWTGTNVWFEGITFDGNNLVNRALEWTPDSHYLTFRKCKFRDVTEPGALSQQAVLLRFVESSSHIVIDDCEFLDVLAPNSSIARGILASVVTSNTYFRDIKILNSRFSGIGDTIDGDAIVIQNFTNQVGAVVANCSFDIEKRAVKMMSPGGVIVNCYSTTSYDTGDLPYAAVSIYADNWQISNWQHVGGRTYAGLETGSSALTATNVLWSNCIIEYDAAADLSAADGAQIVGIDTRNVSYKGCSFSNVRTGIRLESGGTNFTLNSITVNMADQRGINIDKDATTGVAPSGVSINDLKVNKTVGNVIAMIEGTNIFVNGLQSYDTAGVFISTNVTQFGVWQAYDPTATINWQYKRNWAYDPNFNRWHIGSDFVGPWAMNVLSRLAVFGSTTNYFLRIEANNDGANSINIIGPWETSLLEYDDTGNRMRLGSSSGDFILSTTNAYSVGPIQKPIYVERTGDGGYSVTSSKSGYQFSNQDCSASFTTYNLPTPTAVRGETYGFYIAHANGAVIQASGGATIRIGDSVSAVDGFINTTNVGDTLWLTAMNATNWVATSVQGYGWKVDGTLSVVDGYFDELFLVNNNKSIWGKSTGNTDVSLLKLSNQDVVVIGTVTNSSANLGPMSINTGSTPRSDGIIGGLGLDLGGRFGHDQVTYTISNDNTVVSPALNTLLLNSNDATPANRTITFDNSGISGVTVKLIVVAGGIEILDNASIDGGVGTFKLSANWSAEAFDSIQLYYEGTNWVEISRSDN